MLKKTEIAISMDCKGAWRDNVFVERLWRSIKCEEVYLHAYKTVPEARAGIGRYLKRLHELKVPVNRIVSCGGYAKNRLWLQATIDTIGMPVELPKEANPTIIDAAAAAAAGRVWRRICLPRPKPFGKRQCW